MTDARQVIAEGMAAWNSLGKPTPEPPVLYEDQATEMLRRLRPHCPGRYIVIDKEDWSLHGLDPVHGRPQTFWLIERAALGPEGSDTP